MSWLVPAVLGIAGLFGQNSANKSAQANNDNQQAQQIAATQQAIAAAQKYMAPWLQQGNAPFANSSAGPRPAGPTQGAAVAQQVMQPATNPMAAAQPAQPPTPQQSQPPAAGQPAGGQGQMNPQLMALIAKIMQGGQQGQQPGGAPLG